MFPPPSCRHEHHPARERWVSTCSSSRELRLDAPKQEIALLANAVNLLVQAASSDGGSFHGPVDR